MINKTQAETTGIFKTERSLLRKDNSPKGLLDGFNSIIDTTNASFGQTITDRESGVMIQNPLMMKADLD